MFCFVWKVGLEKIVNEKGCLQAGEEWLEHNLLTVAGIAVGIAFLQVGNRSNPRSNHSYHCTGSTKYSLTTKNSLSNWSSENINSHPSHHFFWKRPLFDWLHHILLKTRYHLGSKSTFSSSALPSWHNIHHINYKPKTHVSEPLKVRSFPIYCLVLLRLAFLVAPIPFHQICTFLWVNYFICRFLESALHRIWGQTSLRRSVLPLQSISPSKRIKYKQPIVMFSNGKMSYLLGQRYWWQNFDGKFWWQNLFQMATFWWQNFYGKFWWQNFYGKIFMENFDDNILMAKSVSDGQMGMTARDPSHRLAGEIFSTFQKYSLLPLFMFY